MPYLYPTGAAALTALAVIDTKDLSGLNTVTFSAIPATYTDLEVRVVGQLTDPMTANRNLHLRLNGDTGSNYDYQYGTVSGATTVAETEVYGQTFSVVGVWVNDEFPAVTTLSISHYAETSFHKVIVGTHCAKLSASASGMSRVDSHVQWRNTAAVTSITLFLNTGVDSWAAGSKAVLVGKV